MMVLNHTHAQTVAENSEHEVYVLDIYIFALQKPQRQIMDKESRS